MVNFINFFFILVLLHSELKTKEIIDYKINPELDSGLKFDDTKKGKGEKFVIVSANNYATSSARKIIEAGGNAADAAVTLQLILGLVEPQSSGIGGGSFALFYNNKTKETFHYEGREKAPFNTNPRVFIDTMGNPKKFFDAALGGQSVGVPGTLETLYRLHKDFGLLPWKSVIEPVVRFAKEGFIPSKRLIESLKKEKFIWENLSNNHFFNFIVDKPDLLVKNLDYALTLEKIIDNYKTFYSGEIAQNIVEKIKTSKKNPGVMSLKDMSRYKVKKTVALCTELRKFVICGPQLPSSGGITITQGLLLFENFNFLEEKDTFQKVQDILSFVYSQRDSYLADPEFEKVNQQKLLDLKYLIKQFDNFQKKENVKNSYSSRNHFNSTSHFSIYDTFGNNVTMTSSIESAFGSRLFVDGFLLNNQLTDFSFKQKSNNKLIKNRVVGGKKPLSSMSPIIILDKNKNFLFSVGSPGGIAIISYVFKTIIDVMYEKIDPIISISSGNFVRKSDKLFLEKNYFNIEKIKKILGKKIKIKELPLTSGIAIIKKDGLSLKGYADTRRDGTVYAE